MSPDPFYDQLHSSFATSPYHVCCHLFKMTQVDPAALTFALSPTMTCEDAAKEIHSKTAKSVHPHKMTMQSIIVIAMACDRPSSLQLQTLTTFPTTCSSTTL